MDKNLAVDIDRILTGWGFIYGSTHDIIADLEDNGIILARREDVVKPIETGADIVMPGDPPRSLVKSFLATTSGVELKFGDEIFDITRHTQDTLFKVRRALMEVISEDQATDCITRMQNEGILFREHF